ncbi:hypothetical protein N9B54_00950 [Mariniblastus sp.]|nr:hypothetical protein [Mariniblastus sp.]
MNRTNAVANTFIMFAPLAIAVILAIAMNSAVLMLTIVFVYVLGFSKLLTSKMSLFRQHQWLSFGPSGMDSENRRRYFHGYATIGTAAVLNLLGIVLVRV